MKKLLCLLVVSVLAIQTVAHASYSSGSCGNYWYTHWVGSGSANFNCTGSSSMSVSYSGANFVTGIGWSTGASRTISWSGSGSGLNWGPGVYGWFRNPLVEYYIGNNGGSGSCGYSCNGRSYTLRTATRYNAPSIDGTQTFTQYFAGGSRSSPVDMGCHFNAWRNCGRSVGNQAYQVVMVEGWSHNSGSASITLGGGSTSTTTTTSYSTTTTTSGGPSGYSYCAHEGEYCSFSGCRDVAYGANGQYYYQYNVYDGINCNNDTFGDPINGTAKDCYIRSCSGSTTTTTAASTTTSYSTTTTTSSSSGGPSGYTYCAHENDYCSFSGCMDVAYGANGQYYYQYNVYNGINCDNSTFGDPISGTAKDCYIRSCSGGSTTTTTSGSTTTTTSSWWWGGWW